MFLNYGYWEYVRSILKLLELEINKLEWQKYELWTPYPRAHRQD